MKLVIKLLRDSRISALARSPLSRYPKRERIRERDIKHAANMNVCMTVLPVTAQQQLSFSLAIFPSLPPLSLSLSLSLLSVSFPPSLR